jgi:phosphate transport system protein
MSMHLQREMEVVKRQLMSLYRLVDEQVGLAVRALVQRDADLAREVTERDEEVDRHEIEVEEECLKTLALHQPVAVDLRFIVAALKINNDLERIGDLAVNIARKASAFARLTTVAVPFDLSGMAEKTQAMLRDSLEALISLDVKLAQDVCGRDDEVDQMKRDFRRQAERLIAAEPEQTKVYLRLLAVTRNLERIADLATNIAEDVIYMVEGEIFRHRNSGD